MFNLDKASHPTKDFLLHYGNKNVVNHMHHDIFTPSGYREVYKQEAYLCQDAKTIIIDKLRLPVQTDYYSHTVITHPIMNNTVLLCVTLKLYIDEYYQYTHQQRILCQQHLVIRSICSIFNWNLHNEYPISIKQFILFTQTTGTTLNMMIGDTSNIFYNPLSEIHCRIDRTCYVLTTLTDTLQDDSLLSVDLSTLETTYPFVVLHVSSPQKRYYIILV
jgi:hypothetical protein